MAKLGTADIDLQSLYDYLYFHMIPSPRTVFAGVRRVPGGHSLRATLAGPMLSRYWVPAFDASGGKRSLASLKEEFVTLLRQATEREANDGGPVGAFLSGGTDSSTVVGMLQSVTGTAPEAYSIGFDAEGYDEMEYARLSARHFGARHHEFYIAPADLVRSIPEVARSYDQPFGNSSALPTYYCAKIARGDGIRKMLAGDGGDELFGGNTRYVKQGVFELYHGLPRALRVHLLEPILVNADWPTKLPLVQKLASYVRQARVEMPARMNTYNLLERLGVDAVLESGFLRGVDPADPAAQQRREYAGVKGEFINRMLGYDWKYTLAENDLPKVCGMTSLAGVAVGFPLLDEDIVDFSLRLPVQLKVRGLRLRYFFKEALRGFLPEATLTKKKHGFGLPFGPWLVRDASLRELARDSLHALGRRGLVRRAFVEDLLEHRIVEHPGYYGEMVWILMMLEQWLGAHAPGLSLDVGTAERDRVPTRQALAQ